jgi:hypothetical protein
LILTNSTLNGNTASKNGGGISNEGIVTLSNTLVITNSAGSTYAGGGIFNFLGTLTLINSNVISNTGGSHGGGIANYSNGTLTMTNTTVSGNTATFGGGIYNLSTSTLNNSAITGNGNSTGGGIYNYYGAITATNLTVSGNSLEGINNFGGTTKLTNVTLNGNTAAANTGAIYQYGDTFTETVTLSNTIIANTVGGVNCYVNAVPLRTDGYNLSSDGSCSAYLNFPSDLNNTNPNLGPLQNNGGSTQTDTLLPGSPAIDVIPFGVNGCGTTTTTDQRGVTRPVHGKCDIGAYEADYFEVFLPLIKR